MLVSILCTVLATRSHLDITHTHTRTHTHTHIYTHMHRPTLYPSRKKQTFSVCVCV